MSMFIKTIRAELADKIGTEAINSEVVLNMFENFNSKKGYRLNRRPRLERNCKTEPTYECQEINQWMVGSMDVRALCPSITIKLAQEAIGEAIKRSKLSFHNIDVGILTKYVAVTTPREKLVKLGLSNWLPKPRPRTTLNSFTTNPRPSQFEPQITQGPYSEEQIKKILGVGIANAVEVVMANHFFKINGKIYNQTNGGSIGMDLTGELASLVMLLWDEKLAG